MAPVCPVSLLPGLSLTSRGINADNSTNAIKEDLRTADI